MRPPDFRSPLAPRWLTMHLSGATDLGQIAHAMHNILSARVCMETRGSWIIENSDLIEDI
jgi:hypothetical protein